MTTGDPNDPRRPRADGDPSGPPPVTPPEAYGPPGGGHQDPQRGGDGGPGGHGAPGTASPRNGMGTAAVVVGVLALLLAVLFFPVGLVLAVIGLVLGILGRRRVRRGEATNGGAALVGVALSAVALLVAVAIAVLFGFVFSQVQDCADPDLSRAEQESCIQDKLGS